MGTNPIPYTGCTALGGSPPCQRAGRRRDLHRTHPSDRGQSLTELALMLPLLLIVTLGTVDMGRLFFAYVTVQNASREGARYAIGDPLNNAQITNKARQEDNALLSSAPVAIDCFGYSTNASILCSDAHNGDQIRVTVSLDFQFLSSQLFGVGKITLSGSTTMAITNGLTESP